LAWKDGSESIQRQSWFTNGRINLSLSPPGNQADRPVDRECDAEDRQPDDLTDGVLPVVVLWFPFIEDELVELEAQFTPSHLLYMRRNMYRERRRADEVALKGGGVTG
jgi:hypothetical protein